MRRGSRRARILVTRAVDDSLEWARRIDASGAETIVYPCVVVSDLRDGETRQTLLRAIRGADWLVVTSRRGARACAGLLDAALPRGVAVAAVGRRTAGEARARLGRVDLVPETETSAALGRALRQRIEGDGMGRRIVVASGDRATRDLERELAPAAARFTRAIVYRTEPASRGPARDDLSAFGVDAVLLASPSAARGLVNRAIVGDEQKIVTIGPSTTRAARELGLTVGAEAARPGLEEMMELLP